MASNPIEVAFEEITGMKPDGLYLDGMAGILLILDIFNTEKYRDLVVRCLKEIEDDPDSYSQEVRERAGYQLDLFRLEKLDCSFA